MSMGIPQDARTVQGSYGGRLYAFAGLRPKKWPLRGSSPSYNGALHLVTQESSDGSWSAGARLQAHPQTQAPARTDVATDGSRPPQPVLRLPARRRLRLRRSAYHQRLLPHRPDPRWLSYLVAGS